MSTRARTRAAAAAASSANPSQPSPNQTPAKPTPTKSKRKTATTPATVRQEQPPPTPAAVDPSEKENIETAATPASTVKSSAANKKLSAKSKPGKAAAHCTCSRGDDGSPMILCAECKVWYHFICVDLSEREAEEINVYICSPCTQSTGRKTAMDWEGAEALEDCGSDVEAVVPKATAASTTLTKTPTTTTSSTAQKQKKPKVEVSIPPSREPPLRSPSDESDDPGSEDDYVAEDEISKSKGKRRLRRISSSVSSDEGEHNSPPSSKRRKTKLRKLSSRSQTPTSPALHSSSTAGTTSKTTSRLKRKSSVATEVQTPITKRKRSDTASEDAARKYCLGKFEDLFKEVFERYSYVRGATSAVIPDATSPTSASGDVTMLGGQEQSPTVGIVLKLLEEMSEEEKESLVADSKRFAAELEQCVFDIYQEPDKTGQPHAGAKYKDRFRMLQFNLSKPDRIVLHQRIITGTIKPKEISLMSSTDLADEETKQHIKIAEKESLEQTILQKPIVPRAKITHKGLQDIEDVNGDPVRAGEIERQREREQEEEDRRERERRERLKEKQQQQQQQRQRTQSLSVPPESPIVPSHSPITADQTWGAPPPVPAHVLQHHQQGSGQDDILNPSIRPLFAHPMSDVVMTGVPEPELNLADLINIDEDGAEQDGTAITSASVSTGTGTGTGFVPGSVPGGGSGNVGDETLTSPSSAGGPAPPSPLDHQSIELDGGISDKTPGAHHSAMTTTLSGLGQLSASPTSPMSPTTPTSSVISPFSATRPRGLSFDLNSLWQNAPREDTNSTPKSPEQHTNRSPSALDVDNNNKGSSAGGREGEQEKVVGGGDDVAATRKTVHEIGGDGIVVRNLVMEPEPMEVTNDDDFDMFLAEEKEDVVDRSGSRGAAGSDAAVITSTTATAETTGAGPSTSEAEQPVVHQDPEAAFEAIPHCWTGKIHMPLDSAAPQSTTVFAKQIGGRSLGHQSAWWKTLFPMEDLRIDGRVPTPKSEEFLTQVRLNPYRELVAVAFLPVGEETKADFNALTGYLKSRDRHGLIFPWGQRQKDWAPGRELYLVPLKKDEPLPEYIELLDELKIPKTRQADLLIGIWILYRGKLDNPPPQPSSATPGNAASAGPTPVTPTIPAPTLSNIPPLPPHLAAAKTSQSPPAPPPPNASAPLPPNVPLAPPQNLSGLPPNVNTAALAAEVASLTPEQVQNLLRTLSTPNIPFPPMNIPAPGSGGPPGAPAHPPMPGPPPHGAHPPPPPPPPHPWPGYPIPPGPSPTQPPGGYPPPPHPGSMYGHPPPLPHSHSLPLPPPHHGPPDHERRDSYGSPPHHQGGRGGDRDRGERGWRGGGSGGGGRDGRRGRGKHRGGGNASHRPVDSGWPRRQRNEDENGSPSRRWG